MLVGVISMMGVSELSAQQPTGKIKSTKLIVPPSAKIAQKMYTGLPIREVYNQENPGIVDVTTSKVGDPTTLEFTGRVPGLAKVKAIDIKGNTEVFEVLVQTNMEYLKFMLKRVVPSANIEPIPSANGVVILKGTVVKQEDVPIAIATAQSVVGTGVVSALRVGGVTQVQLDVVIAQVSRNELRQMSFDWFAAGTGNFFGSSITQAMNNLSAGVTATPASATSLFQGTSNLLFGTVGNTGSFFGYLNALRNEGLAKLVACPKLVTMSGRSASFLSGGRLAIPEPSGLGTNAVRYENFGTELNFLPIVLGNGKIYMEVEPIVNIRNDANGTLIGGTAVPGFNTQRVQTSVELEPGQTFVIGGLIQSEVNATSRKVPLVGDLPFLGVLFSAKSFTQQEQELLILVTPHLVDAVTCDQLPKHLPGQETRIPSDFELFLEGILEAPRGRREIMNGWRYNAAHRNGPSDSIYPCGLPGEHPSHGFLGGCPGGCATGGCATGGCATGNCGVQSQGIPLGVGSHQGAVTYPGMTVPVSPQPESALPLPRTEPVQPTPMTGQRIPGSLPTGSGEFIVPASGVEYETQPFPQGAGTPVSSR